MASSPVGIQEVADASGVHISTVSRTFSAPHLVKPETRRRVIETAHRLGYHPNRMARSLATGRTQNVGLIVADIGNPYFPPLIKAAHARAVSHDHHLFVAETNESADAEQDLVRTLARQVDGILLGSTRLSNRTIVKLSETVPLVVVNRRIKGVSAVTMDVASGARTVIDHLISLGHTRLGLITGPTAAWSSREIRRTTVDAVGRAGANLTIVGPKAPTDLGGADAVDELLAAEVTAVLAYNDLVALGVVETLEQRGYGVPDDISVVGVDDIAASRLARPRLTTIAMPASAAGETAMDILLEHVVNPDATPTSVRLDTNLVVRESTAPARPRLDLSAPLTRSPAPTGR